MVDLNRGVIPPHLADGTYQTEHERFEISGDPEVPENGPFINQGVRRDYRGAQAPQQAQVPTPPKIPQPPAPPQVQQTTRRNPNIPPQVDLRVGEHHEGLWNAPESFGGMIDNNENMDVAGLQGADPLGQLPRAASAQPTQHNILNISSPITSVQAQHPVSVTPPVAYVDVPPEPKASAYVVMYNGEVVGCGSEEEVRNLVESLILTKGVELGLITAFKRLSLDYGVVIG